MCNYSEAYSPTDLCFFSLLDFSRVILDSIHAFALLGEGYFDPANCSTAFARVLTGDGQEIAVLDSQVRWVGLGSGTNEELDFNTSIRSGSAGFVTIGALLNRRSASCEVSLSDSRGVEQLLATNALSWEHTDSSSGHVAITSYFDPQRARLHGRNALLSNTSHSEAHYHMDKGM